MNKYYSIILCISLANCFRFEKGKFIPSSLLFLSGSGKFTISGTINNLNTSGMVLKSGTGQTMNISSGAKTFTFPNFEASGTNYSVALSSPPAGQSCTVKNGTGTISSNVSNVQLDCYTSGSFDTSFGNGLGYIETANPAGVANSFDVARGMAIVSGDKIVFSGSTGNDIFACRLNADGSLDTSFIGTGPIPGCSIFDSTFPDVGYAMNVDQNGKIYAAGLNQLPGPFNYVLAVGFNSSGSLDTNFNSTGYVSYKIGAPGSGPDEARAIVPDSSGKIIMSGRSQCTGGGACNWTLWRYNTNGTIDTSFNTTGYIQTNGAYGTAWETIIDSSGRIITTGGGITGTVGPPVRSPMETRRYNSDGSLDLSFNGTGFYNFSLTTFPEGSTGVALALDQSGKIIIAGQVIIDNFPTPADVDMIIWRLNVDGTLDTTFNGIGYVRHNNAAGELINPLDEGTSVAIDSFGRIVVAGVSCNNTGFSSCVGGSYQGYSIVVWRYNPDGTQDTTFNSGSHFKIVDSNFQYQNAYTTKYNMKLDSQGRIVIAAGKDIDADGAGDGQNIRVYRLWP